MNERESVKRSVGCRLVRVEATPSGRRGRNLKATLCSDVPTLEWRLMLQNRLPQFTDLLRRLCDWNSAPYWPLCAGLHRIGRQHGKNCVKARSASIFVTSPRTNQPTRLLFCCCLGCVCDAVRQLWIWMNPKVGVTSEGLWWPVTLSMTNKSSKLLAQRWSWSGRAVKPPPQDLPESLDCFCIF